MNLLERVQHLCKLNSINPSRLEQELGLGKGTLFKWSNSYPNSEMLLKVADYFDVSLDFLMDRHTNDTAVLSEDISTFSADQKMDTTLPDLSDGAYVGILDQIKALCKSHNTSIGKLEKELGFGNGTIYKWETSSPNTTNVCAVADYFDVSVDFLLDHQTNDTTVLSEYLPVSRSAQDMNIDPDDSKIASDGVDMGIVNRIKALCKSRNTTITELERDLSFGKSTISKWKDSFPSSDKLITVANYFDVSVDFLLGRHINDSAVLSEDIPIFIADQKLVITQTELKTTSEGAYVGIVEQIKALCKSNKTSITKLEKELGFGNGTIYKWETASPSTSNVCAVADYFDVSVDFLLGRITNDAVFLGEYLPVFKAAQELNIDPDDLKIALDFINQIKQNTIPSTKRTASA